MPVKRNNGHDPLTLRMVEVLERIEAQVTGLREEVTGLRGEVTGLRQEVAGLREDVRATNARLDTLHDELEAFRIETRDELLDLHAGQHQLRLELRTSIDVRLAKLEEAVFPRAT